MALRNRAHRRRVLRASLADLFLVSVVVRGGRPGPVVVFFQQLADAVVSPALYVGFGTIAGLLFLHARQRARRRAKEGRTPA